MSLAVFFSYALQFYVLMEVLGPNVIQPRVSQRWYSLTEYAVRVAINVFTCRKIIKSLGKAEFRYTTK